MSTMPSISRRTGVRLALSLVGAIATSLLIAGGLVVVYSLVPEPSGPWSFAQLAAFAVGCLLVYIALSVAAIVRLTHAKRPLVTGLTFLTIMSTVLILSYSWLYLTMSVSNVNNFTESLGKISAVYLTVTILSTVGFGDITPATDEARLLVISQMILGFTIITIAIRSVLSTTTNVLKGRRAQYTGHDHDRDHDHDKDHDKNRGDARDSGRPS